MEVALDEFELEGVGNNIPFLSAVMAQERFRYGAANSIDVTDAQTSLALAEQSEIDAIYNPLPNGLHGRWTRAALDACTKYPWGRSAGPEAGSPKFGVYDDDLPVFEWYRMGRPAGQRCVAGPRASWPPRWAHRSGAAGASSRWSGARCRSHRRP
mgnify:CR=1 FL=1